MIAQEDDALNVSEKYIRRFQANKSAHRVESIFAFFF